MRNVYLLTYILRAERIRPYHKVFGSKEALEQFTTEKFDEILCHSTEILPVHN